MNISKSDEQGIKFRNCILDGSYKEVYSYGSLLGIIKMEKRVGKTIEELVKETPECKSIYGLQKKYCPSVRRDTRKVTIHLNESEYSQMMVLKSLMRLHSNDILVASIIKDRLAVEANAIIEKGRI